MNNLEFVAALAHFTDKIDVILEADFGPAPPFLCLESADSRAFAAAISWSSVVMCVCWVCFVD